MDEGATTPMNPRDAAAIEGPRTFRWVNDGPDFLYPGWWVLMQYGTFITIPLAALISLLLHRIRLAVELAVAGIGVYVFAKVVKEAFPREGRGPCWRTRGSGASAPRVWASRRAMPPSRRRWPSCSSPTSRGCGDGCSWSWV